MLANGFRNRGLALFRDRRFHGVLHYFCTKVIPPLGDVNCLGQKRSSWMCDGSTVIADRGDPIRADPKQDFKYRGKTFKYRRQLGHYFTSLETAKGVGMAHPGATGSAAVGGQSDAWRRRCRSDGGHGR